MIELEHIAEVQREIAKANEALAVLIERRNAMIVEYKAAHPKVGTRPMAAVIGVSYVIINRVVTGVGNHPYRDRGWRRTG